MLGASGGSISGRARRIALAVLLGACSLSALVSAQASARPPLATYTPTVVEAPKLSGTPSPGQTLSCARGTWSGANEIAYGYTWLRDGTPIAGQSANTYAVQSTDRGHTLTCQVSAATGGEYNLNGLRAGPWTVAFYPPEGVNYLLQYFPGASFAAQAGKINVGSSGSTAGIDAALSTGGEITGRSTAAVGGAPLSGYYVCAEGIATPWSNCSETNANGEYTIGGLITGTYRVDTGVEYGDGGYLTEFYGGSTSSSGAKAVPVTVATTTAGIDMAVPQGGRISGTVTSTAVGKPPVSGVEVCATEELGFGERYCAETEASGKYEIVGVPTGTKYIVEFYPGPGNLAGEYYSGAPLPGEASPVAVTAPNVTPNIDALLLPGGTIEGTVKNGEAAVAGMLVCADNVPEEELSRCASTNALGHYTIAGLTEGKYRVDFTGYVNDEPGPFLEQFYNKQPTPETATLVTVAAEKTTGEINAHVEQGGRISGTVTAAATGLPVPSAAVCAVAFGGSGEHHCTAAGASGQYVIQGLPSGSYSVHFATAESSNGPGHLLADFYPAALKEAQATPVAVTAPGVTAAINGSLQSGAQITGRVSLAASGAAMPGTEVCARTTEPVEYVCDYSASAASASAISNGLAVPAPNSSLTLAGTTTLDQKHGILDIRVAIADAGTLHWSLSFRNADVGYADALGLNARRCARGLIKHAGRCVHATVPFSSGSAPLTQPGGVVKLRLSAKALRALKAGHLLHVSGPVSFQSALGGAPTTRTLTVLVRPARPHKHR